MAEGKTNRFPLRGEFPFPLMDGPSESPGVTWIRNHSSYLTTGGFWNGVDAVANYLRGVFGNLLILAPSVFLFGIFIGLLHHWAIVYWHWCLGVPLVFAAIAFCFFYAMRLGRPEDQRKSKRYLELVPRAMLIVAGVLILVTAGTN